jgi:hypothetical protein
MGRKIEKSRRTLLLAIVVPAHSTPVQALLLTPQTAGIILTNHPDVPLQIDPGLMERYLGSLQGKIRHAGQPLPTDVEQTDK